MNEVRLEEIVLRTLADVAPDVDADTLDPDVAFRDQFDFDSMDVLNFAIGLHEATGVEIPEADYPRLTSLTACVAYLSRKGANGRGTDAS